MSSFKKIDFEKDFAAGVIEFIDWRYSQSWWYCRPSSVNCCPSCLLSGSTLLRNGLVNWKTILTEIFKNIVWQIFVGESHQVVKITVAYYTVCKAGGWGMGF